VSPIPSGYCQRTSDVDCRHTGQTGTIDRTGVNGFYPTVSSGVKAALHDTDTDILARKSLVSDVRM